MRDELARAGLDKLATRQCGVVSRAQCRASGFTDEAIYARINSGRWRRIFTGVYATFSGPLPRRALFWASLLYAGEGAVLSHQSAGELLGLIDQPASAVHVMIPAVRKIRPVAGVVVRRSRRLALARHPARLPAQTRVEETVLDLTQTAHSIDQALSWVATACGRRLTTPARIGQALRRRGRARWRAELLAALDDVASGCHSLLELRYLRDVERRHGLPSGQRQAVRTRPGGRWYDDVRYEPFRTLVELDGQAAHPDGSRARDRHRDNVAVLDGLGVLRYGTADVIERACDTAAQVARALRSNGWTGRPTPCGPICAVANLTTLAD